MVVLAPQRESTQRRAAPGVGSERIERVRRIGPRFDPGLAGGLRAWLEDAASVVVRVRGEEAPTLHLGARELFGTRSDAGGATGAVGAVSTGAITSALVHALLRQLVTTGVIDDPLDDAMRALRVEPRRKDVVRAVDQIPEPARRELRDDVARHVQHLRALLPPIAPDALPCTDDRVSVPLAGGRVVLHGMLDVRAGVSGARGPEVGLAIGLRVQGSWSGAWRRLGLLAVLETIRSGTPPRQMAVVHTGAARIEVKDVFEADVSATTARVATRLTEMALSCS